jgi:hypothetical protein
METPIKKHHFEPSTMEVVCEHRPVSPPRMACKVGQRQAKSSPTMETTNGDGDARRGLNSIRRVVALTTL